MIQALYQALQISVSWERVSEIHSIMEVHSCISTHSLAGDSLSPYIVPTSIAWCCAQPCLQAMHACAQCSTTSHSGVVLCASVYRRCTPTVSTLHTLRQFKPLVKYLCTVYEQRKGPVVHRARQGLWISRGRPHRTEIFVGAELVFCEGFPHAMRTLKGVGSRLAMA